MKSLEDIMVVKSNTFLQTDKDGIPRKVTQTFKHKLQVRTISAGLRFVHLIADYIVLVIISALISAIPVFNKSILSLLQLVAFLSYPVFYVVMEYKFQQTLGKMITNHVVIDKYANKPDLRTCILRTLIRFVPFEALSCLSSPSRGWHDSWTGTYVVHKDEVSRLKNILEKESEKAIVV